ncbi:MAG: hypothetical protein E7380_00895 [Clostridiales bacterium]|nr:hypothetical protein [Clostridiales bacterium]
MALEKNRQGIGFDFQKGLISSVVFDGREIGAKPTDIFSLRLTDKTGKTIDLFSRDARKVQVNEGAKGTTATYSGFLEDVAVTVFVFEEKNGINVRFSVKNATDKIVEHIEPLPLILKPFIKNGGIGRMLFPYNEGALVENDDLRSTSHLKHLEPKYPTVTCCGLFPGMLCSQFMAYLCGNGGLYIGAHDELRGPKEIDYYAIDEAKNIQTEIRLYSGKSYGEDFSTDFDMVYRFFEGDWQDGAEIYKNWFYEHLPKGLKKVKNNDKLPDWYTDFPIILTYPVRGYHDMDEMTENELFPYINILPYVDKFSKATGARIMVLLMHWEGTAPWAPPYVFPPFGGEEEFDKLFHALKEKGHLLGVYCSGFSFTEQSNVLPSYDCKEILKDKEIFRAFCAGRDGKVLRSTVCEGQRSGYDICVASDKGREILDEAYQPLFDKKLDYVQILDQNHGGSQLFCYSNEHNHPPCVGDWMTTEMKALLDDWNAKAEKTLLGCESAASEPFIQNLLFSDNRFELTHFIGKAVPLYSYLYHEFVHNFMGNQVCNLLPAASYLYRVAYSFAAGDMPTLVLNPKGYIQSYWGQRDLGDLPVEEDVLTFLKNLRDFYMENRDIMCFGNRVKTTRYTTGEITYRNDLYARSYTAEEVLTAAYELDGRKMQIFVNYNKEPKTIECGEKTITLDPFSVVKIEL